MRRKLTVGEKVAEKVLPCVTAFSQIRVCIPRAGEMGLIGPVRGDKRTAQDIDALLTRLRKRLANYIDKQIEAESKRT